MATESNLARVCEVVGIFHNPDDLESAIDELLSSGFDRAELSLLASEDAVATKLGGYYRPVNEMADNPAVPRTAFVSTAAIGDAKGALIGGLTYVGATVAIGAVVMFSCLVEVGNSLVVVNLEDMMIVETPDSIMSFQKSYRNSFD